MVPGLESWEVAEETVWLQGLAELARDAARARESGTLTSEVGYAKNARMTVDIVRSDACRSCGTRRLIPVLDLGRVPLANALRDPESKQEEARYPLEVARCPRCSLVQLTHLVDPALLFRDYPYRSSYSDAYLDHVRAAVEQIYKSRTWKPASRVMEIGSNDGALLACYRDRGIEVLGIEPAEEIAQLAADRGIPSVLGFFGFELARDVARRMGRADVVHANNVMAHVPDLDGFIRGLHEILAPDGRVVIEVPYLLDLMENLAFDTIYHEHVFYFSLTALERAFSVRDLAIVDVERIWIHGGSLRVHVASADPEEGDAGKERVHAMLADEKEWGILEDAPYEAFRRFVANLRVELRRTLGRLRKEGNRIAAYGASAKGSTLLNFCGFGRESLEYVVDRSALKQGRVLPGSHLPILSPDVLAEDPPDYLLLLTWNFADEILAQQAEYRARGGKFIVPVPEPRVIE